MTDPLYREGRKFAHLTSGTNVIRATGNTAWLHSVVVNTAAVGSITVYNNGAASGDIVSVIDLSAVTDNGGSYDYDVRLSTGLTVVLEVTMDVTVIYE